MFKLEKHIKLMIYAIAATCYEVISLMMLIKSSDGEGYKGLFERYDVFDIVCAVIITVIVSVFWIRFIFAYIDSVTKEMNRERKISEIIMLEGIKNSQKKE